jgi:hypothetical protein
VLTADAVGSNFCWSATTASSFVVCDLENPVVDLHEVGFLRKFGYEVAFSMPLS